MLQEKFNSRMEVFIKQKEGKVEILSGFYTEEKMKSELNFSKQPGQINTITQS